MLFRLLAIFTLPLSLNGCTSAPQSLELTRQGDEIIIAGRMFHTGAPVVLWLDPGGYDAYRVERRFAPWDQSGWKETSAVKTGVPDTPNRYSLRFGNRGRGPAGTGEALPPDLLKQVRGGGWTLAQLQERVDQFVYHYDVCGVSRTCFDVLHDHRGLSVHFMLDIDGTIYQTLDVKERAWHATTSNDRSVGIEIANMGAYAIPPDGSPKAWARDAFGPVPPEDTPLGRWYQRDANGQLSITLPRTAGDGGLRTPGFTGHPARNELVIGPIHGQRLAQYDLTPQQYDSLIKLTATLCQVLPGIRCDAPRGGGGVLTTKLPDDDLAVYTGLLGHYHLEKGKSDPGPAFDWEKIIGGARDEMHRRGRWI